MPPSKASMASTSTSLPGVHDILCYKAHTHSLYQWKTLKSCRTTTQGLYTPYIMPLVINLLGSEHTDMHTHISTCIQMQFENARHISLQLVHTPGLKFSNS